MEVSATQLYLFVIQYISYFSLRCLNMGENPDCIWNKNEIQILTTLQCILEYLINVQHLLNVHNGKLDFLLLAKKDNLMLLN